MVQRGRGVVPQRKIRVLLVRVWSMAECSAARIWTVSPGYEQGAQQMKERACLGPGSVLAQPLLAVGWGRREQPTGLLPC